MTLQRRASITALRRRAQLLARTRRFFAERELLEVETASISQAATPDPQLQSVRIHGNRADGYLHTSPEYMMKRLLADGSGDIWQLCRVYRDGEFGRWHEPEFTLLEWYRTGFNDHALMDEVEELLSTLLGNERLMRRATRVTWNAVVHNALGVAGTEDSALLRQAIQQCGVEVPEHSSHSEILDLAFATVVCTEFPTDALTFVYDYPATQASLARIKETTPPVAARFEVFLGTLELGNGFHELTDEAEQRRRFESENAARISAGYDAVPIDETFLAALSNVPDCSGVAIGFDRVVAAALGADSLAQTLAFAHAVPDPNP